MIVTIHQPNVLPWLGFFHKMKQADLFVIADTLAFSRYSYTQRVRINTTGGPKWLTMPILHNKSGQAIVEARCGGFSDWRERLVAMIKGNYHKCKFLEPLMTELTQIIMSGEDRLTELNLQLIEVVRKHFGITTPMVRSSTLDVPGSGDIQGANPTEWIVTICKAVQADTFLSGKGGATYQDESLYQKNGIQLLYSDFKHPTYKQNFQGEFVPGLSSIDLVFNHGHTSAEILCSNETLSQAGAS